MCKILGIDPLNRYLLIYKTLHTDNRFLLVHSSKIPYDYKKNTYFFSLWKRRAHILITFPTHLEKSHSILLIFCFFSLKWKNPLNSFSFQNSSVENNYLLCSAIPTIQYIIFWYYFRLKNKCVFFWVFSLPLFVFLSIPRKSRARSLSEPNDKSQFVLTKKSVVVWDKDHFLYPI